MASDSSPPANDHEDLLQFDRLEVTRFNGLDHGLTVDLCGGINVIYGPNASGKTTLAHAIRALLWPEQADGRVPIVEGRFRLDGDDWRVELEGERCLYVRNEEPASRPPLPPAAHGPRYHLYLHDLLGTGGQQDPLARRILQEAQGGVDVEGAAEALGFEVPSRRTAKITKEVEELDRRRRDTKKEQEALRRTEQTLDDLREQRADAQRAARRAAALEQALEVAEARQALDEAEAAVEQFPDVLETLRGDEVERLDTLQEKREEANRQVDRAEAEIEEAQATLQESRIPEEGLPDGRVETLRTRTSTLLDREGAVDDRRSDVEEAETREAEAWDRLPTGIDRETAADIALPEIEAMDEHVRAVEDFRGREEAVTTARTLFAVEGPEESVETLREGLKHLHRWLQFSRNGAAAGRGPRWAIRIAGSVVLAVGVGLAVVGPGLSTWVGIGLVALGVLILGAEWMRSSSAGGDTSDRRGLIEDEYRRLELEPPDAWTRAAVEAHADALLRRLRTAAVAVEKRDTWERLQPELDLEERAEELARERTRLAKALGVEPDVQSHTLSWLLDRLSRWQNAYDDLEGARAALEAARETREDLRAGLNEALAPYDLGPVADGSEAQGAVETLATARTAFRDARRALEEAEKTKESAVQAREDAEAALADLYARLDLDEGAEDELQSLVDRHAAYREVVEAEQSTRATLEAERRRLRREEEHAPWMEEATTEALTRELDAARAKAETADELLDRIKSIEHDVERAREEGTLEAQQAKYRARRDALAEERHGDYRKAVGAVLAEVVQEETRDQGLPPVFHRARALFAEITDHRYELTLDRSSASFRAVDTVYEQSFAIDELSSGTQVQLVLSVRIAFLETQEQTCRAPLVLDETLANSDADRARAIIEAVTTISEEGRQVLYLTAQADEVQKWQAALDEREHPEHAVLSLGNVDTRSLQDAGGDGAAVPERRVAPSLPDPEATSHEALRTQLDVPDWSPRQPVGRLHLWYLIERPAPLLSLLTSGTRTWGQLEARHRLGGTTAVPFGDRAYRRLDARARAVEAWKTAWHVGRGRPVDRAALEETDAVTDTFIDGVTELAKELNGHAEALLEVVRERDDERVSGFRSAKADELAEYLREYGYLTDREPLSGEDMWQRILAEVGEERQENLVAVEDLERLFERLAGPTARE